MRSIPSVSRGHRMALTLVEMLVVIGVCGVLALMLVPMVLRSRGQARTIVCADNLKTLGQAYGVCLLESGGALPDVYYTYEGASGSYQVALKSEAAGTSGPVRGETRGSLACPSDEKPVTVMAQTMSGNATPVSASYAYNLSLPLLFQNQSRVPQPLSTVTFFDGDIEAVTGQWNASSGWAQNVIRKRHHGQANYLYLDGHVETEAAFPEAAFDGGLQWLASSRNTLGAPAGEERPGSGNGGGNQGGNGEESPEGKKHSVGGSININPGNGNFEFTLILPTGVTVTRDHLHDDTAFSGPGFASGHLEYTGSALAVFVKPKGNGNQNGLYVDGKPYAVENKNRYEIRSEAMTVRLYNDKRNSKGKAMGKWWIDITATQATIRVVK